MIPDDTRKTMNNPECIDRLTSSPDDNHLAEPGGIISDHFVGIKLGVQFNPFQLTIKKTDAAEGWKWD